MLVPGCVVRELPVQLSNVNSIRFGPDGRLYTLGYDGRIHALSDTNGDGLEDEARPYWDKPTLRVPVGMAWGAEGLYVSSQGKVSLLRDTNSDGRADVEQVLASGWPKTDVASGGVDATSVTLDAQGKVYFGLLCADFSNAYRIRNGQSHYDLRSDRGTIQQMNADGSGRTILCTGIRVPYALAFNRAGDLFLTDQEGETWLPGGNPLDELNHIVPGRHYGFPPRHEKHLPDVIDEPPVVRFGPQHQSTCGLIFNEPSAAQGLFGPAWWEGNALVAGFSRGKIWRVTLHKTPAGYVGRETLIASSNMMVADLAISAEGELYVACHSGQPDWGTGPRGAGKLFKITYHDRGAPQPVAAWPAKPGEVFVAFDRPLPESSETAVDPHIEFGPFVRSADRYETLRPGYKSVKQQQAAPRTKLNLTSHRLSADRRTLILFTDPHPQRAHYALTVTVPISRVGGERMIDMAYDLSGVRGRWTGEGADGVQEMWLPHVSTDVSLALLAGTEQNERLDRQLAEPGQLELEGMFDLPSARHHVRLEANAPFHAGVGGMRREAVADGAGRHLLEFDLPPAEAPVPLSIMLTTGANPPARLHLSYRSAADDMLRPVPLDRLLLPWVPTTSDGPSTQPTRPTRQDSTLAGGDPQRGEVLFTNQLKCATCHRSDALELGPDLSNLAHRDPAAILYDISHPSASINPDYVAYHLKLRGGRSTFGFVHPAGDEALRVVNAEQETVIQRDDVLEMRPSGISAMPEGLLGGLTDEQTRDLLAFLVTSRPAASQQPPPKPPATNPTSAPSRKLSADRPPARTAG